MRPRLRPRRCPRCARRSTAATGRRARWRAARPVRYLHTSSLIDRPCSDAKCCTSSVRRPFPRWPSRPDDSTPSAPPSRAVSRTPGPPDSSASPSSAPSIRSPSTSCRARIRRALVTRAWRASSRSSSASGTPTPTARPSCGGSSMWTRGAGLLGGRPFLELDAGQQRHVLSALEAEARTAPTGAVPFFQRMKQLDALRLLQLRGRHPGGAGRGVHARPLRGRRPAPHAARGALTWRCATTPSWSARASAGAGPRRS